MICPDCNNELVPDRLTCSSCGWMGEIDGKIQVVLGKADRQDPVLTEYLDNYDIIAAQDVDVGIVDDRYLKNLAKNLVARIGDVRGKEILDVGVGKAYVVQELLDRGVSAITAVDISRIYLRRLAAQSSVRCVLANAENLPFKDEFDLIVSTDVMEHVLNIGSFLLSINQALRKNGRFIVRVPYRESLLPYSPKQGCPYRFVHLRTFNKGSLTDYLNSAGFEVERLAMDSYTAGHPRKFWMKTQWSMNIYSTLSKAFLRRTGSLSDTTLLPSWIAGLMMPPLEIIAIARKVKSVG